VVETRLHPGLHQRSTQPDHGRTERSWKVHDCQKPLSCAILAGYSVLFRSASALIEDLQCESVTARRRKLRTYGNAGLLCIDEVGYLSYDDNAADSLYEIVNRLYERRSLIVTTNRGFKEWNEVFPNASCIVTLVDRLTHHADVTKIEGESYRLRESEQEAATRRKKK